MTEPSTIERWRREISEELVTARAELAAANEAVQIAKEDELVARLERSDLADAIDRVAVRQPLANALAMRRAARDREHNEVVGRTAKAKNQVASSHRRVEDLLQALDQLDQIAPRPEPVEHEAAA